MSAAITTATVNPAASARAKLMTARKELDARLIERTDEIETCLIALVAGEHCLFVGPPGTGKSMLCDAVSELIHGGRFSYLMTKFTDPAEIVGPLSLPELKAGRYVRITADRLPTADVAFLDEIFKSSSAILNTLLKMLNERTFNDGTGEKKIPLRLCVAASNEWPNAESQQELGALFDRFLLRRTVRPIQSAEGRKRLLFDRKRGSAPLTVRLTPDELNAARAEAADLPWSEAATDALSDILRELAREGILPGDRRQYKAVGVVQAAAWMDGAAEVKPEHLGILSEILWDSPEEQPLKVAEVVAKIANPTAFQVNAFMVEAEEVIRTSNTKDLASMSAAAKKLSEIARSLKAIGNPRADKAYSYVTERVQALKKAAMDAV